MSADEFQNKYASVMESMLRTAVAETTKLFETMVDELKEEISHIRKENEELKIRCNRFEKAENDPTVHTGETNTPPERSVASQKRDSSVQCDITNTHDVPGDPFQPLQDHLYTIKTEHDYPMRLPPVQHEVSSSICSLSSELELDEVEHCVISEPDLNYCTGSVESSTTQKEELCSIKRSSTDKRILALTDEERRGSDLRESTYLQGDENQPSVLEQSPFTNIDEDPETLSKTSEKRTEGKLARSENHQLDIHQCQRESETLQSKQTDLTWQHSDNIHCTEQELQKSFEVTQEAACKKLKDLRVRRRRRGQPKTKQQAKKLLLSSIDGPSKGKSKQPFINNDAEEFSTFASKERLSSKSLQASSVQPDDFSSDGSFSFMESVTTDRKHLENRSVGPLPVSDVALSCSHGKQEACESKRPLTEVEKQAAEAASTESACAITSLKITQVTSIQHFIERQIPGCLQDATVAVEAMNQCVNSLQMSSTQTERTPFDSKKIEFLVNQQTPSLSGESPFKEQNCDVASQIIDATATSNTSDQIASKHHHAPAAPTLTEPPLPATPTRAALSQSQLMSETVLPSKLNTALSRTVIVVPRSRYIHVQNASMSDVKPPIDAALSAQSKPLLQPSTTLVSTPGKTLHARDLQKTINNTATKLVPVVSLLSMSTSRVKQPVTHLHLQDKALFQKKVLALASGQSQMNVKVRQPIIEVPVLVSRPSTQLKPTSVGSSDAASNSTAEKLKNATKTACKMINTPSKTCSQSNMSTKLVPASLFFLPPPNVAKNLSPVVRLPRLPLIVATSKSISISRLPPHGSYQCSLQGKHSTSPASLSQMPSLSFNLSPTSSTKKFSSVSVDTLQIVVESNEVHDQASLPADSSTVFKNTQSAASIDMSVPALEESKEVGNMMEVSSLPTAEEKQAPNYCKEITSKTVQDNRLDNLMQLAHIALSDTTHPHSQMSKSQFLSQLAVVPKVQVLKKVRSAGTGNLKVSNKVNSIKKSFQKTHFLTKLQSHQKSYLQAKGSKTKLNAKRKIATVKLRKQRSHDTRNSEIASGDKDVLDCTTKVIPSALSSIGHIDEGGQSKDGVSPETIVGELAMISSGISGDKNDDSESDSDDIQEFPLVTPVMHLSADLSPRPKNPKWSSLPLRSTSNRDCVISENESFSVSPRTHSLTEKSAESKEAEKTSVRPSISASREKVVDSIESNAESTRRSTSSEEGQCSKESSTQSTKSSTSGGNVVRSKESCAVSSTSFTSGGDSARSQDYSPVSPQRSTFGEERERFKKSSSGSPRNSTLGGDSVRTKRSISVSPKKSNSDGDGVCSEDSSSVSLQRSTSRRDSACSKESSSVSLGKSTSDRASLRSKESSSRSLPRSTLGRPSVQSKEYCSVRTRSTSGRAGLRSKESSSVSIKRSTSGRANVFLKEFSSTSRRISTSGRDSRGSKESSCSSSRVNSGGDSVCSKKSGPVSPRRPSSTNKSSEMTGNVVTPEKANSSSMRCRRSSIEATYSEKSATVSTSCRASGLSEISASLEMSTGCHSTSSKDKPETESSLLGSESCSVTGANLLTKKVIFDNGSPSVLWPKMAKSRITPIEMVEPSTAKKPRRVQDDATPEKSFEIDTTWTLASAVVVKTVAEIKNWKNTKLEVSMLQNKHKSELKRWKTEGVWTPPTLPPGELPHGDIEKMARDNAKNAAPKIKPVRPVGIISPSQPLLVIGKLTLRNQCGQCGRTFSNNVALENHVSLHKKRRPLSCNLCGKSFPDSRALKRHDRVHRNGKIHICSECGKGFVYNFYLTKHLQMVHSTVRSAFCSFCNKGFFTQREVEVHERIHTGEKPFSCDLCERKFSSRVKLNVHLRWHKGEKRHWCTFCTKGFLDYNNLKRHLLVHTGEKPYSCPICAKCFSQTGHLKKHVANVHKAK